MFRFTACCKFGSFAYLGCRNMLLRDFHLPLFVIDKWVKCYCELILGLASLIQILEKVFNCRYYLIIGPILLPSQEGFFHVGEQKKAEWC